MSRREVSNCLACLRFEMLGLRKVRCSCRPELSFQGSLHASDDGSRPGRPFRCPRLSARKRSRPERYRQPRDPGHPHGAKRHQHRVGLEVRCKRYALRTFRRRGIPPACLRHSAQRHGEPVWRRRQRLRHAMELLEPRERPTQPGDLRGRPALAFDDLFRAAHGQREISYRRIGMFRGPRLSPSG